MRFEDIESAKDLKGYLERVLSRSGGKTLDNQMLYHYTSITSIRDILSSGYVWLGSTDKMNDFIENSFINSVNAGRRLFFSSFSRAEENIAMYKMYASAPDGAMMHFSYNTAKRIVEELPNGENGFKKVRIVKDNVITNKTVDAKVYWIAVCYKYLHEDTIKAETVYNKNFTQPLNNPELAGIVKLNGWEYEREVRLCAETIEPLANNEKIAIKLPSKINSCTSIITCPNFDYKANRQIIMDLKRLSIKLTSSEYENMVDLGFDNQNENRHLKERINALKKENIELKAQLKENDTVSLIEEDIFEDGYHEIKSRDGVLLSKGNYINGHLVNGIEYNHILKIVEIIPKDSNLEVDDEIPVPYEKLKEEKWTYEDYGQYEGHLFLLPTYRFLIEEDIDLFYVVDKKVHLEGKRVKPTFKNFKTLEEFLSKNEPDELDYIRTGKRKYDETDEAEFILE